MNKDEKQEKVAAARAALNKDFGKGTVMSLSEKPVVSKNIIATGSLGLNLALGVNGYPRGRMVEIYGPESSGKTTLAIHAIAEAHKDPESYCAIIDA